MKTIKQLCEEIAAADAPTNTADQIADAPKPLGSGKRKGRKKKKDDEYDEI